MNEALRVLTFPGDHRIEYPAKDRVAPGRLARAVRGAAGLGRPLLAVLALPGLLARKHVARLMGNQGNAHAVKLALDLGGPYRPTAHDAGTAGSSVRPGHAIDGGQTTLRQAGAYLPPQFVVRAVTFNAHDDEVASTGMSARRA